MKDVKQRARARVHEDDNNNNIYFIMRRDATQGSGKQHLAAGVLISAFEYIILLVLEKSP